MESLLWARDQHLQPKPLLTNTNRVVYFKVDQQPLIQNDAVQQAVDELAEDALKARELLHLFDAGKNQNMVVLYADGTWNYPSERDSSKQQVAETKEVIVEYAFPTKENGELKDFSGFTFQDLVHLLYRSELYLSRQSEDVFPNLRFRPRWIKRLQDIRFGTSLEYPSSRAETLESIKTALDVINYIIGYSSYRDEAEPVELRETETEEVSATTPAEPVDLTSAAVIPAVTAEAVAEVQKKLEEDKEKKEPDEQKKKEQPGERPVNLLQLIARGDAALHKEVVRMEVMLSNQILEFYAPGLDEKAQTAFKQQILPYITPHVLFELQKLGIDDLGAALRSSKLRTKIYFNALIRMQQDPSFRARLFNIIRDVAKVEPKKAEKKAEETPEEKAARASQPAQPVPALALLDAAQTADKIIAAEGAESFLSDEEIDAVKRVRSTTAVDFADEIKTILGKEGVGLAETDINNILVRLQAFAITRRNIHRMTDRDFEFIFKPLFGDQNPIVFYRIKKFFDESGLDWARLFSTYVLSTRMLVYNQTKNPAVLFLDRDLQSDSAEPENHWHTTIQTYGFKPVTSALYSAKPELEEKKQQLEAAVPAGELKNNIEYGNVVAALKVKGENVRAIHQLARLNPLQQRAVFKALGYKFSDTVYEQLRIDATLQFFKTVQQHVSGVQRRATTTTTQQVEVEEITETAFWNEFDPYVAPQLFQYEIVDGSFVIPPEVLAQYQYASEAGEFPEEAGADKKGHPEILGYDVDKELGKLALLAITGGESKAIVETVEKTQQFLAQVPGGDELNRLIDEYGWEKVRELGKLIRWLLTLAFISFLLNLLGTILFWIGAAIAGLRFGLFLKAALSNAAIAFKSFVSQATQFISQAVTAGGKLLSSAVSGATSALTGIVATSAFNGALIASATVGVMGFGVLSSTNFNGAFLTNVGGASKVLARPTTPNVGCFRFVNDPGQIAAYSAQYGVTAKQFTAQEERMIAIAGGIAFSYQSFFDLLCGPPGSSREVTLVRASGTRYGGWAAGLNLVILYDAAFGRQETANYTLWHEAGHIIDKNNGHISPSFLSSGFSGGRFETYPVTAVSGTNPTVYSCAGYLPASEALAETVTVYLMNIYHPGYGFPCSNGPYDLLSRRPLEYAWAQNVIYGGP